jgi:hypothetical protein
MLTELMREISEFIAEVFKNWEMETRIRHLFRERSKNATPHEAKILQICHDEKVGWTEYHRPLRPKCGKLLHCLYCGCLVPCFTVQNKVCVELIHNFGFNNGGTHSQILKQDMQQHLRVLSEETKKTFK